MPAVICRVCRTPANVESFSRMHQPQCRCGGNYELPKADKADRRKVKTGVRRANRQG